MNSQALESRRELRPLRGPGSVFLLKNLSGCLLSLIKMFIKGYFLNY